MNRTISMIFEMLGFDDALRVISELNRATVEYAVVGGMALNIHGVFFERRLVLRLTCV